MCLRRAPTPPLKRLSCAGNGWGCGHPDPAELRCCPWSEEPLRETRLAQEPATAPLNLDASRRPPSEELLQLCLLRPEHRSLAASTRSSPEATLWCEGLGPETRGLHLCFHQSVGTARSHLRLKADDRARSCGGSDSCWETSLGPNTPQLRSEDRVSESRV